MRKVCVVLDVEGRLFKTSLSTLTSVKSGTLAKLVAGGDWKKQLDEQGHVFIDRDSTIFPIILSFLRDGICIPLPRDEWMLSRIAHEQARYFNLPDLEKLALKKKRELEKGVNDVRPVPSPPPPTQNTNSEEAVEIPRKRSEILGKNKRPNLLRRLSISLPRNFSHLTHIGWRGSDLVVSTSDISKNEPVIKAIAKAAKEAPASQVYNVVEGDSSRYGSQGVEVVLGANHLRTLPARKAPIPPFTPPPPSFTSE